jgi:hypothetical protein
LVEQRIRNAKVPSSNPGSGTKFPERQSIDCLFLLRRQALARDFRAQALEQAAGMR